MPRSRSFPPLESLAARNDVAFVTERLTAQQLKVYIERCGVAAGATHAERRRQLRVLIEHAVPRVVTSSAGGTHSLGAAVLRCVVCCVRACVCVCVRVARTTTAVLDGRRTIQQRRAALDLFVSPPGTFVARSPTASCDVTRVGADGANKRPRRCSGRHDANWSCTRFRARRSVTDWLPRLRDARNNRRLVGRSVGRSA